MDPYVYPGTSVLRNLRGIRDPDTLNEFEAEASVRRIRQLEHKSPSGAFDTRHIQAIHHHISQDVYPWAGEFRTVDISKGGHLFGLSQHVVSSLNKTCAELKNKRYLDGVDQRLFANRGAYYLGELNAILPFRDGNGRTHRESIRQLASKDGHSLDWTYITREEMIEASRQSFQSGDNAGLQALLRRSLDRRDIDDRFERGLRSHERDSAFYKE
jgi:cell filamentation protein